MGNKSKLKPHILVMARLGVNKGWVCWDRVHTEGQAKIARALPDECGFATKLVFLNPRGP